jgi:hypothetical protein
MKLSSVREGTQKIKHTVYDRFKVIPSTLYFCLCSATKLGRNQLNVCTVYGVLFPPLAAEICARLAGNFCQLLATVKSGANDMLWLNVLYFVASQQGEG